MVSIEKDRISGRIAHSLDQSHGLRQADEIRLPFGCADHDTGRTGLLGTLDYGPQDIGRGKIEMADGKAFFFGLSKIIS